MVREDEEFVYPVQQGDNVRAIKLDEGPDRAWCSQRWRIFDAAINWDHITTVLNIGATKPDFFLRNILDKHGCIITVLEVYRPYVHLLETDPALEVHCGNLLGYEFEEGRKWDMVLWWNGAEHLVERSDLDVALANLEPLASKLVICGVPWGTRIQPKAVDGNPLQIHRQFWDVADWESRGFGVILCGPKDKARNQLTAIKVVDDGGYTGPPGQWWTGVSG